MTYQSGAKSAPTYAGAQKQQPLSGLARGARVAYLVLATAFAICVAVQIYIAGMAIFAGPQNWAMHVQFIHFFEFLPVLMLLAGFPGKLPARMHFENGILIILIGYMYFAANIVDRLPLIAATHPVMAVVMFVLALSLLPRVWRLAFPRTGTA